MATDPCRSEGCGPAVVFAQLHRHAHPSVGAFRAPQQIRGKESMAIPENVGPHLDWLIDDPLHGKAPGVDEGIDIFDIDSTT